MDIERHRRQIRKLRKKVENLRLDIRAREKKILDLTGQISGLEVLLAKEVSQGKEGN